MNRFPWERAGGRGGGLRRHRARSGRGQRAQGGRFGAGSCRRRRYVQGQRQDRREERRGGTGVTHYRMRQKLVSIGDDYWIENDQGERVFKVDGKALRARKTLIFEDSHGTELLRSRSGWPATGTLEIEDPGGHTVATVKKALITPLRDRWTVTVGTARTWTSRATSWTTSTPSRTAGPRWPRCRKSGSGSLTPRGPGRPRAEPRADAGRHGRPGPDGARGTLHRRLIARKGCEPTRRKRSAPVGKLGQRSRHDLMVPHVADHGSAPCRIRPYIE